MKCGNLRVANVIVMLLLLFTTCGLAGVIKVPSDFPTIQAAIDASVDGDTVLVAPGTYTGDGNRDIDFKGKAITVRSTDPNNLEIVQKTIIDCQGTEEDSHRGFQFISGEGQDSVLAGLKIINGSGSEIKVSDWYNSVVGGAVLCLDSSPTIFGCVIDRNFVGSSGWGGGIYCFNSSAAITKCIIQYNKAYAGGGIFCNSGSVVIEKCTFDSNSTRYSGGGGGVTYSFRYCGGGICCLNSSAAINRCTIQYNKAGSEGGGIYCSGGDVVIDQCQLSSNISSRGGGIFFQRGTGRVLNCLIGRNLAQGEGGGIYFDGVGVISCTGSVLNSLISTNLAYGGGGGIYYREADVTLDNCTVVRNFACGGIGTVIGGVAPYPPSVIGSKKPIILTNCILWGNSGKGKCEFSTQVSPVVSILSHCCIQGWTPEKGGVDNFGDDPLLTVDSHLQLDSPCINTGILNDSFTQSGTDIDGEFRELGGQIDIGCDEYTDLDNDGLADFWELKYFETTVNIEALQNPDEDQWTNIQEYNQSSNPVRPPTSFYVNAVNGDDGWDGLSPAWNGQHGPKATIQAAINQASFYDRDSILLAPGTYSGEGNRDIDFKGKSITVKSEQGPQTCVIDCKGSEDEPHRGFYFHSIEDSNSVLQGVTIINGYTSQGGGIYCMVASPHILDCLITENTALDMGGGIKCDNSDPTIIRCIIRNNSSNYGGGVGIGTTTSFLSRLMMTNCLIIGNKAEGSGGGVYCNGEITLLNCTISGNRASGFGGGGIDFGTGRINNSILYGNIAREGSEIYLGPYGAGGCRPDLIKITYSVVGSDPNAINIPRCLSGEWLHADPLFANPGYWDLNGTLDDPNDDFWVDGDYHLKSQAGRWDANEGRWTKDDVTSPCIDAGDPNSEVGDEPVPNGGRINMGAYGGTAEASKSP